MARWRTLTLLFVYLAVLLILMGCISTPFGGPSVQERPVPVIMNNSANVTQTFTVWVVEGEITLHSGGVKIYKRNGEVDNASPGEGLSTYYLGDDYGYVTAVELPANRSRLHSQYTVRPSEQRRITINNSTIGSTIVVSLSENGRIIHLTAVHCSEQAIGGLEVHSYPTPPGGAWAGYECR